MIDPPSKGKAERYTATLLIEGAADDRHRRLRRAVKLLLRACGVRIVELRPEAADGGGAST